MDDNTSALQDQLRYQLSLLRILTKPHMRETGETTLLNRQMEEIARLAGSPGLPDSAAA